MNAGTLNETTKMLQARLAGYGQRRANLSTRQGKFTESRSISSQVRPQPTEPLLTDHSTGNNRAGEHTPAAATGSSPSRQCKMVHSQPLACTGDADSMDKRRSFRKPAVLAGIVCNENSTNRIAIIVKDMSATGVRFMIDRKRSDRTGTTPKIDEAFQLYITYDKMTVPCQLQWRDGDLFGARFLKAPQFY